jgi:hypothetical protein
MKRNLKYLKSGPKQTMLCLLVGGALAVFMPALAQQSNSGIQLYDNFDNRFLDPSKWLAQWQCGGTVMECVREIQEDRLRLRVRAYGATDSNDGTQFGSSGLSLVSSSVTDIATDLTVRRSTADSCSTNPGLVGHAQVLIFGSFFNGGGNTPDDDVKAALQLDRYSSDSPGVVLAGGFLTYQGQFFDHADLGPVNVGEHVRVELLWDQPNHRFVIRLFRLASGIVTEQVMPYTISDTTAAVSPFRSINANVYPANCVGTRTSSELEVLFNDVFTK